MVLVLVLVLLVMAPEGAVRDQLRERSSAWIISTFSSKWALRVALLVSSACIDISQELSISCRVSMVLQRSGVQKFMVSVVVDFQTVPPLASLGNKLSSPGPAQARTLGSVRIAPPRILSVVPICLTSIPADPPPPSP